MKLIDGDYVIRTPVDKLVDMIRFNRDLSIDSASKILAIEKKTISNWLNILESAGVIKVRYKALGAVEWIVCK